MTASSYIRVISAKDRLVGLMRRNGTLERVDLGPAEYDAFVVSGTAIKSGDYVFRSSEHPGWDRLVFKDYDQRTEARHKYGALLFESDISPSKRYLITNDVRLEPPRRAYLDIETDSRVPPREQVEFGEGRIVSWALVDEEGRQVLRVLEEDDNESEGALLHELWSTMGEYDQVAAWFGDTFDFPVIEHRSQKMAKKVKLNWSPYWEGRRRILFVDQALCFKRHHMAPESGDDKTSMKLNAVCMALLGEGKHDFDARKTWEAWAAGGAERQRMADYNLQDTALLPKLEAATGYLELQQTLAEVSYTPADSHGLKPMPQVDGVMLRLAFLRGTHLPSKSTEPVVGEPYEGAFVLKPTKLGVHENVHVCDFVSLYPTVARSLNIGWDTKGDLGCTAFGTNVCFGNETESMLAAACRELMAQRDAWKKKAKADPNDKYAERMNKAYKIACNSIYGVMGSTWSRYYDVEVAESITLGAKALAKATQAFAKEQGLDVIYMDTDSLFVLGCDVEEFKVFVHRCNTEVYPKMLADAGANLAFNCIKLDYEKCFSRLVFPLGKDGAGVAKRYFGSYLHYAFKPKEKPEIRGLEYMRGDGLRFARHMQHEAIMRILRGDTAVELEEWVVSMRDKVATQKLELEDIVLSKGIGQDLDSYKNVTGHVALAREMAAAGEDVGAGSRIPYVIVDGRCSPLKIVHADKYDGTFDRHWAWNDAIYPATFRVLRGAFEAERNWKRWFAKRPKPAAPGQASLF